ncbi:MAG TPA: proline--tRNA ligase, partial [Planctomycetota bacterium]|nr:proline--tRNA ligase [Planctomycetota bacterium]
MKWTNSLIPTVKEDPADAESISHKLMMRSGLIRKLAAGTYNYLPLGMRILNKTMNIVRQEMDRAGALEVLLPALLPPEPWEQTGRLKDFGDNMFKVIDRTGKLNVLGPTHEEIITSLVANEISSYRQLPVTLYQIQTKFRDELRPRFGIIRSKEFLMMDAYSFHTDGASLDQSYKKMYDAYCRIFDRCKLPYKIIEADPGLMGGSGSHEFTCPSPAGEDLFVTCTNCSYSSNPDLATIKMPDAGCRIPDKDMKPLKEVATPGKSTIEALAGFLNAQPSQMVKTMICNTSKGPVAALVRGDYELNLSKLAKLLNSAVMELADEKTIAKVTGGPVGFSGPVGLKNIPIIADYSVLGLVDFITGANKLDAHLLNTNINRDFKIDQSADIRMITDKDNCPSCGKPGLKILNGIELGHIFKLGTKYSKSLNAQFLDEKGVRAPIIMGCYGIGINRIIAAAI